jgi:hypothetical protein
VAIVVKIIPYLLAAVVIILVIYGLVQLYYHININTDGKSKTIITASKSIIYNDYPHEDFICSEVNRQIQAVLDSRLKSGINLVKNKMGLLWLKLPWNNDKDSANDKKKRLEDEQELLRGCYNSSIYCFRDEATTGFLALKKDLNELKSENATIIDYSPRPAKIIKDYKVKGDMKYFRFAVDPICLQLGRDVFLVIPYYVLRFRKNGAYVTAYKSSAIRADICEGFYNERIRHVEWYGKNSQRTFFTTEKRTVHDMLQLGIAEYHVQYMLPNLVKNTIIHDVDEYTYMTPTESIDPIYHLVRLLSECDDSTSTKSLQKITSLIPINDNFGERTGC